MSVAPPRWTPLSAYLYHQKSYVRRVRFPRSIYTLIRKIKSKRKSLNICNIYMITGVQRGGATDTNTPLSSSGNASPLSIFDQNVHPLIELVESSIFLALFAPLSGGGKKNRAQIFAPPGQIWLAAIIVYTEIAGRACVHC